MPDAPILVVNAGSSSVKTAVFDAGLTETLRVEATGIGGWGRLQVAGQEVEADLPDNAAALRAVFGALAEAGVTFESLRAVAHRVVHGGATLTKARIVTPAVREAIAACIPLAPLHNPNQVAAIDAVTARAPGLVQCASFDTAFHATIPEVAYRYALPEMPTHPGLRRYGFHGTSSAALVAALREDDALPPRLLALHLGNGASLCAIRDGRSVATTMGFSPVSGLTMGSRAGVIDAGAVLELVRHLGLDETEALLHNRSGLLGLSQTSADMRRLEQSDTAEAGFAIDHFIYWIIRQSGSMIAAMGGLDAVAFTGGIGENSANVRDRVVAGLAWAGDFPVHIVPAREEIFIAREAAALTANQEALA